MVDLDSISAREKSSDAIDHCMAHSMRGLHICDRLEALADDLPKRQAPIWRETQAQCQTVLIPHFVHLSEQVLPLLINRTRGEAERQSVLLRLSRDCETQTHVTSDLDDLLTDALVSERFDQEPEALGFALRGCFDSLRRSLHWELDVLWPLAWRALPQVDVWRIAQTMRVSIKAH